MLHLFCINPAAGKRDMTRSMRHEIVTCCTARGLVLDWDYAVLVSEKPGDITRWVRETAAGGDELRVYACGGDGTLNEVVNGAVGFPNVAVTHYPCGSGNDFIKVFHEPEAFSHLPALLDDPEEAAFDLIDCNGSFALNTCSLGLDARIGNQVGAFKRLPLITGSQAYLLSALVNTIKGIHRHYRVEINGEVVDGRKTMIFVGNGRWYGGGFLPVPEADPADGLLDVLLVEKVSRRKVFQVIEPYKQGKYRDYPELIRYYRTDSLCVECDKPEAVGLDGESIVAKQVQIRLVPAGLRVFYPRGLTWKPGNPSIIKEEAPCN